MSSGMPRGKSKIVSPLPLGVPEIDASAVSTGPMGSEANAYLAAIVESADDAIISKSLDGIIMSWNGAAERLFGYTAEEVIGKPVLIIIPPERTDEEKMILGEVRKGNRVDHYQTARLAKNGELIDVSLTVSPVRDASGQIIGASKIARDVTDRLRAEEALRAKEQMQETVTRLEFFADATRELIELEDPTELRDSLLDKLAAALGLDFCYYFICEGPERVVTLRGCRGIPSGLARRIEKLDPAESSDVGGPKATVHIIGDLEDPSPVPEILRENGFGAYIRHPLVVGEKVIGALSFGSLRKTTFNEKLVKTIRLFCEIISTAIARTEAEEALAVRVRQQRSVAALGLAALREDELHELADLLAEDVADTLEVELCGILELMLSGEEVLLRSGVGWGDEQVGEAVFSATKDSQAGLTLRSQTPVIVDNLQTETRFNGKPMLLNRQITSSISCIIGGEQRRPWGVLGVYSKSRRQFTNEDVSYLQGVANVLASFIQRKGAEQQFRLSVEAAPNGMVLMDERGGIKMANSEMKRLFGYQRQELLERRIETLLPGVEEVRRLDQENSALRGSVSAKQRCELLGVRKDGSSFPVEVGLNPAETRDGTFTLAAIIDISERNRMKADLTKAHEDLRNHANNLEAIVDERTDHLQQMVAELEGVSYSLSHDMRAPLRTIRSFTEIVLKESGEKLRPDQSALLERVSSAAGRLDRLIQDVLVYSRVSRDAIDLQVLEPEAILSQIIDERPELRSEEVEIIIESPLLRVRGHEAYLIQCFTNLLDNAVKFVPPDRGARIRIWTESTGEGVRLWIEDNGSGLPDGSHDRVFEMFERLHDEKNYPGTGIGLAIVRRAVERMGGCVGVVSAPSNGCRFWLQLKGTDSG